MPTYQYACTECGHQLEAVQSFTDDPLTVCPACDGRLRKQFGSVGIVFKGPGFYRTDSRNGSNGNGKVESKSADSTSESKTDSKTDSKPAGTSETSGKPEKKSADKSSSTTAAAAS